MYNNIFKIRTLSYFSILLLSFFVSRNFYAQSEELVKAPVKEEKSISIDEISAESEKLGKRIFSLKQILEPSTDIKKVDSLLEIINRVVLVNKDSLFIEIEEISRRQLKVRKVEWGKYLSTLKDYRDIVNERTKEISIINEELLFELQKWEDTKLILKGESSKNNTYGSLDKVIISIKELSDLSTIRLANIFIIEKNMTDLILIIDEVLSEISNTELQLKKDYFVFDSSPIWSKSQDSIKKTTPEIELGLVEKFNSNKETVTSFFKENIRSTILQVVFVLLIFFLMFAVRRKWSAKLKDLVNPVEIQAKIILRNYIAATISSGILISAFFYDALIPNVSELFIFLILLGTLQLLPKLTNQRFLLFLSILFVIYIVNIASSYLVSTSYGARLLLLLEIVVLFWSLLYGRKIMSKYPEGFVRIYKVYMVVSPIYQFILIVSLIANIVGMVALAYFLFNAVFISILLMMVLYSSVKVTTSLLVFTFKLRKKYELQTVSTIIHATNKRIQPILFWTGMFIWFYFTLRGFEIFDFVMMWIDETLQINWKIGESKISLGGILSFTGIFIITILIAKLVASIFQDEWMVNILPRGIAPAISLILRIVLIGIGFYIGVSSAGIDLSRLGFIIGALGVGIGFGLQNVVLNFIAGLILAFERPINLGDAIQIDDEFGVVTSIGIRSSSIRSYAGYEAIIPNGDLISKKVVNWTLSNRDRRSNVLMKTSAEADPEKVIALFNDIASNHPQTFDNPEPITFFKGYEESGNLLFQLWYWSTFSDTLTVDHEIALEIFKRLKEEGIQAPAPVRRIIKE